MIEPQPCWLLTAETVKKLTRPQRSPLDADQVGGGTLADEGFERQQDKEFLHEAMGALSPEYREVLILSRFQEMKYEEIAKVLNINEGTVKVRVHRALGELKKRFFTNERN
mgnify:CR=1 FL=1